MGFGINFNNKPMIQEAKSAQNDGGSGGNTGYFENEGKKDDSEQIDSVFIEQKKDSFNKEGEDLPLEDFSIAKLIAQIILAVKTWFKKTFLGISEPEPKDVDYFDSNK